MNVKLKLPALIVVLWSFIQTSFCQENTYKIGINISSIGQNSIRSQEQKEGDPTFDGKNFFSPCITFIYSPCTCSDFETGIEYSHHSLSVKPNLPSDQDNTPYTCNIDLVSIPANFRINLVKYFFINAGILLSFDISKSNPVDSQTGIGVNYGLGVKYDFKNGLTVYANPYTKTYSWISFLTSSNKHKLDEYGVKFGISYIIARN